MGHADTAANRVVRARTAPGQAPLPPGQSNDPFPLPIAAIYVMTFALVILRPLQPMPQNVGTVSEQLAAAGWLCWTIPLLTTELVLQRRKILRVRA
jgi:hypothetical protein